MTCTITSLASVYGYDPSINSPGSPSMVGQVYNRTPNIINPSYHSVSHPGQISRSEIHPSHYQRYPKRVKSMSATFANVSDDSLVSPLGGPWETQSITNYTGRSSFASSSPSTTQGSTKSSPNRSFSFDLSGSALVSPRTSFGSRDGTDGMSSEGKTFHSPEIDRTCSISQPISDHAPMSPVLYDLSEFDPHAASEPHLDDVSFYSFNPGHTSAHSLSSYGVPTGVPTRKPVPTYGTSRPASSTAGRARSNSYASSFQYKDDPSLNLVNIDRKEYPDTHSNTASERQSTFTSLARYVRRKGQTLFTNATRMAGSVFPSLK